MEKGPGREEINLEAGPARALKKIKILVRAQATGCKLDRLQAITYKIL
jgi:hypothetical protein|tara:strand:- start:11 stop:154 length:144 start_codon:yes stop_codon:yes gene_type:complete